MKNSMKILTLLVLGGLVTLEACKTTHHDPIPLSLTAIMAGTADLNGAIAPTGVDPASTIVATFTTTIDATTATTSNVTLTRDFDKSSVAISVSVAGNKLTITPTATLSGGATFVVALDAGLKSTAGLSFTAVTRSFTTSGSFTPDGQISYWSFENTPNDVLGVHSPASPSNAVDITYVSGRNTAAGKAASFNGTTSIIEIPNGDQIMNPEFSIAFWMNLDSSILSADGSEKGHFVMGVAAFQGMQFEVEDHERWVKWAQNYKRSNNGVVDSAFTDFYYNGGASVHGSGRDTSIVVTKAQTAAQIQANFGATTWNHIVYTFSATTKVSSLYWNGVLVFQEDYNFFQSIKDANWKKFYGITGMAINDPKVAPGAADYWDKTWAFGFWESRASTFPSWGQMQYQYASTDAKHYKGGLDDIHLYHRALSTAEITLMYNSEK